MTHPIPSVSAHALHSAAVARLSEDAYRLAVHIVARARAARRLGATADAYRVSADGLDRQADRAQALLFGQAIASFRAAAAENRQIAEALDALEDGRAW